MRIITPEYEQERNGYRIKNVDELTFADDFMFGTIMRNADVCRDVLECLLQMPIGHVEYPEMQKSISPFYEAKGVRLDVFVRDSERVFDVEMQTSRYDAIGRRTRYYQSLIDIDSLQRGADYSELKDSFVIFICLGDPFDKDLSCYTFTNVCKEDKNADWQDGTTKILFNASAYEGALDKKIRSFLRFIKTQESTDSLTNRLKAAVSQAKYNDKFRSDYMQYTLHERDVRRAGYVQGMVQGEHKRAMENARNFLRMGLSVEQVAQGTGLPIAEVQSLSAQ